MIPFTNLHFVTKGSTDPITMVLLIGLLIFIIILIIKEVKGGDFMPCKGGKKKGGKKGGK